MVKQTGTGQEMSATKIRWQMMEATPQVGERRPQTRREDMKPRMRDERGQRHKLVTIATDQEFGATEIRWQMMGAMPQVG